MEEERSEAEHGPIPTSCFLEDGARDHGLVIQSHEIDRFTTSPLYVRDSAVFQLKNQKSHIYESSVILLLLGLESLLTVG